MVSQTEIILTGYNRGFHLITHEIVSRISSLPDKGLLNLFVKHTSCALSVCENWDPEVRGDLERIYDHLIPERQSYYQHTLEGDDDMPAHAKSVLTGTSINIPITGGRLNLGTWQGIYLCEFRNDPSPRHLVATVMG